MLNKRLGIACLTFGLTVAVADLLAPATFATIPVLRNELVYLALVFGLMAGVGWRNTALLTLAVSVGFAVWAVYQVFPDWRPMNGVRASAVFGSANYLGGFAMLCVFLALVLRLSAWPLGAAIGSNAVSLALSESRAALLGLMCGLFCVVPKRWRLAWLAAPALALVVLGLHGTDGTTHRMRSLRAGLSDFLYRPFLGWGQDSPHPSIGNHYYNIAMEWLVGTGVFGFALFLWCAIEAMIAARKLPDTTRGPMLGLLVAYLVNGMMIYDTIGTSTVLVLALSFLVILNADESRSPGRIHDHQALAERD